VSLDRAHHHVTHEAEPDNTQPQRFGGHSARLGGDPDDRVDLDVDERWPLLPTLVDRVSNVKGVREVRINGRAVDPPSGTRSTAIPA